MSQHPSRFRKSLLATVAVGAVALAGCVAEAPARPGVDYGYVAGTGAYSTAPTPYAAAPYGDPYDDPYYDSYYGYGGPYYGGGYYYGPSTTFVYSRDHYYPAYGYRSRGNSYREDRHDSRDHHWNGNDHGDHHWNGDDGKHRGDHDGGGSGRGDWNHDRPGRPDSRPGNSSHQDNHPRPVMGGNRPGLGAVLNRGGRVEHSQPPPVPAKPDQRRSWRERR